MKKTSTRCTLTDTGDNIWATRSAHRAHTEHIILVRLSIFIHKHDLLNSKQRTTESFAAANFFSSLRLMISTVQNDRRPFNLCSVWIVKFVLVNDRLTGRLWLAEFWGVKYGESKRHKPPSRMTNEIWRKKKKTEKQQHQCINIYSIYVNWWCCSIPLSCRSSFFFFCFTVCFRSVRLPTLIAAVAVLLHKNTYNTHTKCESLICTQTLSG